MQQWLICNKVHDHTCAWLCVVSTLKWGFRLSQDYVASVRVGVRSKVMHGGVMKALVLAADCDLLSASFPGDLINCYTGYPPQTSTCKRRMQHSQQKSLGTRLRRQHCCWTFCPCPWVGFKLQGNKEGEISFLWLLSLPFLSFSILLVLMLLLSTTMVQDGTWWIVFV